MSKFLDYTGLQHYHEKAQEEVQDEIRDVFDSYEDFQYVLRAVTGTTSLVDTPSGTRLRIINYIPAGCKISASTTDSSGVALSIHNTAENAVWASATGRLENLHADYIASWSGSNTVAGYLGISMTNGSTAISDERKAEMLASLTIRVVFPETILNRIKPLYDLEKLSNVDSDWETVSISFGRTGDSAASFPNESNTGHCLSAPILAKKGDLFKGSWNMPARSSNMAAVYKTNSSNSVGISPLIDVDSSGTQDILFRVEEDCYITLQFNQATIDGGELYVKHAGIVEVQGNSIETAPFELGEHLGYHRIHHWKNGTYGNKGNSNYIHCDSFDIPDGTTLIYFKTSRPNAEGCHYSVALRFLDASNNSIGSKDGSANTYASRPILVPEGAKRLYFSLAEYVTSSGANHALRYYDMDGYESWFVCNGYLTEIDSELKESYGITNALGEELPFRDQQPIGAFISMTDYTWTATGTSRLVPAEKYAGKWLYVKANPNYLARFAFLTANTWTVTSKVNTLCLNTDVREAAPGKSAIAKIPDTCKYIYVYENYNNTNWYVPDYMSVLERADDNTNEIHDITEGLVNAFVLGYKNVTIVPSHNETYHAYYRSSLSTHFSDGLNNVTALKRLLYFPEVVVSGGHKLTLRSTGLNQITVFELAYKPLGTSPINAFSSSDIIKQTSIVANTSESWTDGVLEINLNPATRRIACVMGATQNVTCSLPTITDNIISITFPVFDTRSITQKAESEDIMLRQARYVHSAPTTQSLGILHYSDIHGDDISVNKIKEFVSQNESLIDVIASTGDVVHYYADSTSGYPNASTWWKNSGLAEKSLFVLGNHDGALSTGQHVEGSADWDAKGKEWDFDTYFADYISTLGISMPSGYDDPNSEYYKSCFWHKDYAEAKVRIIGLDCMHFNDTLRYTTGEQETWLSTRLAETISSSSSVYGYSVIFMSHYPIDDWSGDNETWDDSTHKFVYNSNVTGGRIMDYKTGAQTNFHSYSSTSLALDKRFCMRTKAANVSADYGYDKGTSNPIGDIIQSWVNAGGKYVAWLCGHCHYDMFFYSAKYPNLLCVAIDQAGNLRGNNLSDRGTDLPTRYCANFYSVDTQNGLFKIVRYGLTMDKYMTDRNVLCYDYINKIVVNE